MNLRLARAVDCAAVTACVRAAYSGYVERIGREPAPMTADYADLIAHAQVHVLESASHGHLQIQAVLVLHTQDHTLWIDNVAVHPEAQHHGLGRRLIAFAEHRAYSAGLSKVQLYTHELMIENIALYQRLGYTELDRCVDQGFPRVFMHKSPPPTPPTPTTTTTMTTTTTPPHAASQRRAAT